MSNAFEDWSDPLPDEEREALLNQTAKAVVGRGLETPAIFALEMHKPLGFLASQGMIFATPLLGPLLGPERMQKVGRFLAEPGAVDKLIQRIEEISILQNSKPKPDATTGTEQA